MAFQCVVVGLMMTVLHASEDIVLSLDGNDWVITSPRQASATVPGSIFVDLMNAGVIEDAYYGNNPDTTLWISNLSWTYTKEFNVSQDILNKNIVQLIAEGIDTKADVYINNKLIFMNDNMFHRNYIEIKSLLKQGINNITIYFYSKVKWALNEAASCNLSTDALCPEDCHHGFCDFNYIRTEPCSAGWDWGPKFGSMGIWHTIYLQAYNSAVIRDFLVSTFPVKQNDYTNWNLSITVFVDSGQTNVLYPNIYHDDAHNQNDNALVNGKVQIVINELNINKSIDVQFNAYNETNITLNIESINNPLLWYPNGYGNQKLYITQLNYIDNNGKSDVGLIRHFGFRIIELNQPIAPGKHGKLFYFSVNGVTVPVHGSNWIPMDAFQSPQRINKTSMEYRFIALRDSHQNMMRNWGGGIYQQNYFYDMADEYGIMIWEDMMFASDQYWIRPSFLQSVTKEVFDQTRRLQHHASIALFAGNNENEHYCANNPKAYSDLYYGAILNNVGLLDLQNRPRLVSSPCDGNETQNNPCSDAKNDIWVGDEHKYLYDQDCWNLTVYTRSRFQSEFGLQSWPSFPTMREYLAPDQWYYNSSMMVDRNKHPHGQSQMLVGIQFHYNLPPNYNTNESFEYVLYLTQAYQAYCYKVEIEYYRSMRYNCSNTLPGCNMGQMYWQTNDIWPGASWSSIDWKGRYKMVQYYAQHFNEAIIVAGFTNYVTGSNQKISGYEFWIIADESAKGKSCQNCKLEFFSYSWSNGSITSFSINIKFEIPSAELVYTMNPSELLSKTECNKATDCVIKWILHDDQMNILTTNWMFVESPKKSTAKDPQLQITNVKQSSSSNNTFIVSISVKNTAAHVWFETKSISGYFEDNGLLMEPGTYDNIIFHSRKNTTSVNDLQNDLYVYSLYEAGGFANY